MAKTGRRTAKHPCDVCGLAPFPVAKTEGRTGKHSCDVCGLASFLVAVSVLRLTDVQGNTYVMCVD